MTGNRLIITLSLLALIVLAPCSLAQESEKKDEIQQIDPEKVIEEIKKGDEGKDLKKFTSKELRAALAKEPELVSNPKVLEAIDYYAGVHADYSVFEEKAVLGAFLKAKNIAMDGKPNVAYYAPQLNGKAAIGFRGDSGTLAGQIEDISAKPKHGTYLIRENGEVEVRPEHFGKETALLVKEGIITITSNGGVVVHDGNVVIGEEMRLLLFKEGGSYGGVELINSRIQFETDKLTVASSPGSIRIGMWVNDAPITLYGQDMKFQGDGLSATISGGFHWYGKFLRLETENGEPSSIRIKDSLITVSKSTEIRWGVKSYIIVDPAKESPGSSIAFDGYDQFRVSARGNNQIKFETIDGKVNSVVVEKIPDSSVVELAITSADSERTARFFFSNDPPIAQGDLGWVSTKILHQFHRFSIDDKAMTQMIDYVFTLYQGTSYTSETKGTVKELRDFTNYLALMNPSTLAELITHKSIDEQSLKQIMASTSNTELLHVIIDKIPEFTKFDVPLLKQINDQMLLEKAIEKMEIIKDQSSFFELSYAIRDPKLLQKLLEITTAELSSPSELRSLIRNFRDESVFNEILNRVSDEKGLQSALRIMGTLDPDEITRLIERIPPDGQIAARVAMQNLAGNEIMQEKVLQRLDTISALQGSAMFTEAGSERLQSLILSKIDASSYDQGSANLLFEKAKSEQVQIEVLQKFPTVAESDVRFLFSKVKSETAQEIIINAKKSFSPYEIAAVFELAASESVQQRMLEKNPVVNDVDALGAAFRYAKSDEIRAMLAESIDSLKSFEINKKGKMGIDSNRNDETFANFRSILFETTSSEQALALLGKTNPKGDFGWNKEGLTYIMSDSNFKEATKGYSGRESWDVAVSVLHNIERLGIYGQELPMIKWDISAEIKNTMEFREQYGDRCLLCKGTTYIPVTNDEKWSNGDYRFQEDVMQRFAIQSGVDPKDIVYDMTSGMKGPAAKTAILGSLETSSGSTAIHFNGHAGPTSLWLTQGTVGAEVTDQMRHPNAISYVELGDALLSREAKGQSIKDVNVLIDSCYGYDFGTKLYDYLREKGAESFPVVVAEANRGQYGYSILPADPKAVKTGVYSEFMYQIFQAKASGEALTIKEIMRADRSPLEDFAIFVPNGKANIYGSNYDDPWIVPTEIPRTAVQEGETVIIEPVTPKRKPSMFIEIGKVDRDYSLNFG